MSVPVTRSGVVTVRIGELVVGSGDARLKTLLGSCIGIALYDVRNRVGGLAHVVLPSSVGHDGSVGKFVDTAVPELIRQVKEIGGTTGNLRAKLAGGANMFSTDSDSTIGDLNLKAMMQELADRSITIVGIHCGGTQGRRMTFQPATGSVRIEVVGSEAIDI